MKPIWKGAIGFGLVNIPVKLYSASVDSTLDLDMLDKKDLSRIHFMRVNENSGKPVEWKNIVKGYNLEGDYVILQDEDFAKASPEKSKLIAIDAFVVEQDVDSIYFETPYFLEPDKAGEKAYFLLYEALEKSGKAGLGSFVLRSRENLCLIKPYQGVLVLNKIRFAEEIRSAADFAASKKIKPKPEEMKMALSLVDQLTTKFSIDQYKDTYSEDLMKLIKLKAKGKTVKQPQLKVTHRKTTDLMAQLKASLKKAS